MRGQRVWGRRKDADHIYSVVSKMALLPESITVMTALGGGGGEGRG